MVNYLDLDNEPQVIRDLYGIAIFNNDGKSYDTLLKIASEYEDDEDIYSVTESDDTTSIIVSIKDEDNDLFQYVFSYDSEGYLSEVYSY